MTLEDAMWLFGAATVAIPLITIVAGKAHPQRRHVPAASDLRRRQIDTIADRDRIDP